MKLTPKAILAITLLWSSQVLAGSEGVPSEKIRFEAGLGSRNQTPIVLITGISYQNLTARFQGFGIHNGPNDFWCGYRGSLLWTFFYDKPFNVDVGVGGGYEFAEAPNKMHKAINEANKAMYLRPYNYKEILDASLEIWTHVYGIYTQISVPVYRFKKHDAPTILWGAGYTISF